MASSLDEEIKKERRRVEELERQAAKLKELNELRERARQLEKSLGSASQREPSRGHGSRQRSRDRHDREKRRADDRDRDRGRDRDRDRDKDRVRGKKTRETRERKRERERERLPEPTEEQLQKVRRIKEQQVSDREQEEEELRRQYLLDKESRLRTTLQARAAGQGPATPEGGEADDELLEEGEEEELEEEDQEVSPCTPRGTAPKGTAPTNRPPRPKAFDESSDPEARAGRPRYFPATAAGGSSSSAGPAFENPRPKGTARPLPTGPPPLPPPKHEPEEEEKGKGKIGKGKGSQGEGKGEKGKGKYGKDQGKEKGKVKPESGKGKAQPDSGKGKAQPDSGKKGGKGNSSSSTSEECWKWSNADWYQYRQKRKEEKDNSQQKWQSNNWWEKDQSMEKSTTKKWTGPILASKKAQGSEKLQEETESDLEVKEVRNRQKAAEEEKESKADSSTAGKEAEEPAQVEKEPAIIPPKEEKTEDVPTDPSKVEEKPEVPAPPPPKEEKAEETVEKNPSTEEEKPPKPPFPWRDGGSTCAVQQAEMVEEIDPYCWMLSAEESLGVILIDTGASATLLGTRSLEICEMASRALVSAEPMQRTYRFGNSATETTISSCHFETRLGRICCDVRITSSGEHKPNLLGVRDLLGWVVDPEEGILKGKKSGREIKCHRLRSGHMYLPLEDFFVATVPAGAEAEPAHTAATDDADAADGRIPAVKL
jgi:hypothetical protein